MRTLSEFTSAALFRSTLLGLGVWGALCVPAHAAEIKPERLWLPASAQHLRPFLHQAAEDALLDPDCAEVLYARLNEYRTAYEEPTFSVLCKKDFKTTFNKVYHITQIDPDYHTRIAEADAAAANATSLADDIERLRQQLMGTDETGVSGEPQAPIPGAPAQSSATANASSDTQSIAPTPTLREDPNDLSLDLDLNVPSSQP